MTDAKIIKALECCSQDTHDCDNCPLDIAEESLCFNEIKGYALDLINRQKAEIERLTINMNAFGLGMKREKERADTAKAEIERLQKENNQFADIGKMYSEIKSEAIKEFAERFLSIAQRVDRDDVDELILIKRDFFDSFVKKEMAGDTE